MQEDLSYLRSLRAVREKHANEAALERERQADGGFYVYSHRPLSRPATPSEYEVSLANERRRKMSPRHHHHHQHEPHQHAASLGRSASSSGSSFMRSSRSFMGAAPGGGLSGHLYKQRTTMARAMTRTPSAPHRLGLHILGKSVSMPVLTPPGLDAIWLERAMVKQQQQQQKQKQKQQEHHGTPSRPLTPSMQTEVSSITFNPRIPWTSSAAAVAAEAARQERRAKAAPGPKLLRITDIACEDLPDADKGMGAGGADPYLTFLLVTDRGEKEFARTKTIMNAPRNVAFPDVLEMAVPMSLLKGFAQGTLVVRVWDDDSVADGLEGVNADDLMGQNAYKLNCRLTPYRLAGHVDRATYDGVGALYAFRVSFKYEAIPAPDPEPPVVKKKKIVTDRRLLPEL